MPIASLTRPSGVNASRGPQPFFRAAPARYEPVSKVGVDLTLDEANPADYDGLLIPGGFINPDLLRQSADARASVRAFGQSGKPIASLCHGP